MDNLRINEFENYCKEQLGLSHHSLRAYKQDLINFLRFKINTNMKHMVESSDIIAYQKKLREVDGVSPATIRRRLITLRAYFKWLKEIEKDIQSPFEGLRLDMKIPKRLPRPIDRPTLGAVFQSVPPIFQMKLNPEKPNLTQIENAQITGLIARILVVTGMRIGELTSLRVRDVTGAASQIRVHGKGDRERTVYISNDQLKFDFRYYWEHRRDEAGSQVWLFINSKGERLTPQAYRKRLRTLSQSLKIEPYITPHQFRHSAATLLIEEGVDIRLVQRLLGHASIATTEIYTKVSDNSLSSAIMAADTLACVDAY